MSNLHERKVKVDNLEFCNSLPFILISGPCQIEGREHALKVCSKIDEISKKTNIKFVYKSSFDKANRSSHESQRGVGLKKGLEILAEIKERFNCPVLTDVHESSQCKEVSKYVDIIQIPAFLCRQTDLLIAASKTNCTVNVKKGQFLSPWEMKNVVSKLKSTGNEKILVTERGTMFGYNNLVNDMRSLPILKETGFPVIFDATHSVQLPGTLGKSSGGQRKYVETLSKAAITTGISSVFIETHDEPSIAPSDGPNMVALNDLSNLLSKLKLFDNLTKKQLTD